MYLLDKLKNINQDTNSKTKITAVNEVLYNQVLSDLSTMIYLSSSPRPNASHSKRYR